MDYSREQPGKEDTVDEEGKKSPSLWKVLIAVVTAVAVIKELRTPKPERTWHGELAGFIPYDFRMPSIERFRDTYWNPDGPIIAGRVFGVGWTLNLGAVKSLFSG